MTIKKLSILLVITLFSFTNKPEIKNCYITYQGLAALTITPFYRVSQAEAKPFKVPTSNGDVQVSLVDGYRIEYNNTKNSPFVVLKVVLSDAKLYAADTANVIANLKHLNATTPNMETKDLIQLNYNGYKIYGISSSLIEKSKRTLGNFVIFPGNNTILYLDFNNLSPDQRTCETITDYKTLRNAFLGNYTMHLKNCTDK